jgi:DNA-binding beta-propeller fold protein YncE
MGGINSPWGVATTCRGEVVVTEWGRHCVSVYSPSGDNVQSFGTKGSGLGQFEHPYGVAVDGVGNILVADCGNRRIQKFDQFFTPVHTGDSGLLQVIKPTGIAFNTFNNKVYVVDTGSSNVIMLNSDLTLSGTFGNGLFVSPYGIACDRTGKVYVTDSQNHCIHIFTPKGEHLGMFGRRGQGRGELDKPFGVTVDSSGMVYVSEWGSHRVSVFNSEGRFVTSFGKRGEGPGEFEHPRGLAVDDCGVVYVCDRKNGHVQVF